MTGFTNEEKFLNNLGEHSFLRFWSWPNLYRNQGDTNRKGDGKEICDLTVIFGNTVILFSDKRVEFNTNKPIKIAWARWARKAIGDSVKQIKGARRWFEAYPERIFMDKKCQQPIPISIPNNTEIQFFNIVVCHGIEDILASFNNNESSFLFDNSIHGNSHWNTEETTPFCIGSIFEGDFVHIFNESTIELALNEFNTAKDFTHYLSQREKLLNSDKHIKVFAESDMVQLYYKYLNEENNARSIWPKELDETDSAIINMGGIQRLYTSASFLAKKQEDQISYFWDDLIECFSFHTLNGSAEHTNWEHPIEVEPSLRFLADTSRFERRILAIAFHEFYEKVAPSHRGTRLFISSENKGSAYLFLLLPYDQHLFSHDRYREIRRKMIGDYCAIHKHLNRNINSILGIACKTRNINQKLSSDFFNEGQDFIFIYGDDWDEDDYFEAEKIHNEYVAQGFLVDRSITMETINEFPEENTIFKKKIDFKGRDRNLPCICGSGKKLKKCCGRP